MKQKSHRIQIGTFLILGTLLALYLTISVGYDIFAIHNAIMFRGDKFAVIAIYAILPLLFVAGLISTISFFLKSKSGRR